MERRLIPDLKTGPWRLSELDEPTHGLTVFSCFCCGGGSTMGYKLAGFRSVGGCDVDPQMSAIYRRNHSGPDPWHFFEVPIQDFKSVIPDPVAYPGLVDLDVLDGSPPCSSFSMAGNREDDWSKNKKFREGQTDQVLDDLFFHFIDVAKALRPKVVIAENVKGLVMGNARGYVKEIFSQFRKVGFDAQLFVLDASRMGVTQMRERTFFVCRRSDLNIPKFRLSFDEPETSVMNAFVGCSTADAKPLSRKAAVHWERTKPGGLFSVCGAATGKMNRRLDPLRPAWTQTATPNLYHWREARHLSRDESVRVQSFPDDYDFLDARPGYVCGMSVPPLMMQRVASEVARALLSRPGRVVHRSRSQHK